MTEQKPLFCVGDIVRIKSLEEIRADIGGKHNALCGWCAPMDSAAGNEYEVVAVLKSTAGGFHYSYRFDGTGLYWFSEDVLEAPKTHQNSSVMSFDELMHGCTKMAICPNCGFNPNDEPYCMLPTHCPQCGYVFNERELDRE